jgi:hypothetical protein
MNGYELGAFAGVLGGVAIAGVGMVYRAAIGGGFWSLPNGIGGIALGPERGDSSAFGLPTVTGVGLHMVLSAVYGAVTVWLAHMITHEWILTGFSVGVAVWLFNYYVVGRFHAGAKKLSELNPVWVAFVLHALFGLITGVVAQALGA